MELFEGSSKEKGVVFKKMHDHDFRARNFILASMNNKLQRQHEHMRTKHGVKSKGTVWGVE